MDFKALITVQFYDSGLPYVTSSYCQHLSVGALDQPIGYYVSGGAKLVVAAFNGVVTR